MEDTRPGPGIGRSWVIIFEVKAAVDSQTSNPSRGRDSLSSKLVGAMRSHESDREATMCLVSELVRDTKSRLSMMKGGKKSRTEREVEELLR